MSHIKSFISCYVSEWFFAKSTMDCGVCGEELATLDEVMFFHMGELQVHMTIKPEETVIVKGRSLLYKEEKKVTKVESK